MYCEGIRRDRGDLRGVPHHAVQVANMRNLATAARHKVIAAEKQMINYKSIDSSICHCVSMIRLRHRRVSNPYDRWRVVFSADQFARYDLGIPPSYLDLVAKPPSEFSSQLQNPCSNFFIDGIASVTVCRMAKSRLLETKMTPYE